MIGYLYLSLAIVGEVIATLALKSVDGLSRPVPLLIVFVGYCCAFWLLSIAFRTVPVGIAYAIWAGMGVVLVSIISAILYQQRLDVAAIAGMVMIVGGVMVMQLFSTTSGH